MLHRVYVPRALPAPKTLLGTAFYQPASWRVRAAVSCTLVLPLASTVRPDSRGTATSPTRSFPSSCRLKRQDRRDRAGPLVSKKT